MATRWGVALLAFVVVGCGCLVVSTPKPTPLSHATGARDVLLRMWVGGGLPNPGKTVEEPPEFTLYGNGRVIHVTEQASGNGPGVSELRQAQLTDDQIDVLLRIALNDGGLGAAQKSYSDVQVFDAGSTWFEVHAGGVDKTVRVYALGFMDNLTPSAQIRAAFRLLAGKLHDFAAEVTAGRATDVGLYEPEAYRVTLIAPLSGLEANADWPWPGIVPADFAQDSSGARMRIMTAAEGAAMLDLGITYELVTRAPDGNTYMIRIHLLLPDEMPS